MIAKGTNFGGLPVAVVLLTMHRNERFFNAALDLGVAGYVLKDSAVSEIVSAIHAVSAGNRFVTPLLTDYLLNRRQEQTQSEATKGLTTLTEAERRVMKLIAEYKSSQEIADELFISIRTVDHGNTENAEEAQRI